MITVNELKEIFSKVYDDELNTKNFSESSDLRKDVGMNSISLLYMAMVLEEKYGIQFDNSDFPKINTVADVIHIIEEKASEKV